MIEIDRLKLIEEILKASNTAGSPDELLNVLIDRCIELTGALTGSIMIINPETKILEIQVYRGLKKEKVIETNLRIGQGVTGKVAQTGKPILINNAGKVKYYIRIRKDLKSELAVPIKIENKIIGVISVDSNKVNAFTKTHQDLLESISDLTSQILFKANLIEELKQRIERQNLLLNIAGVLEEEFELTRVFERIMKLISQAINLKRGMLVLLDEDNRLKIFSGFKLSEEAIQRGVYEIGEGITGKVVKIGKSIAIKDVLKDKEFLNKMKIQRGKAEHNSFFAVPIKYENKTVGVLGIEKEYVSEIDFNHTRELLTLISTLVSNKVHNYELNQEEKEKLRSKNIELKEELLQTQSDIIFVGKSKKITDILNTVKVVSDTDATVLITGETGTGKEIVAKMIHHKSKRWEKPFISVNCAAIPENLLESELFGYKKGAFTGATADKKGKFQLADKGTIFLDEIGDLNIALQSKILRTLQEKVIEPLGSEISTKIDVRIIAATNKDLSRLANQNEFREDLYYRLNVINIKLPPLRDRKDDIPLFIDHFIKTYDKKYGKKVKGLADRCVSLLTDYTWPGNIRELENIIERAVILSHGDVVDINLLPENISRSLSEKGRDHLEQIILQEIKTAPIGEVYQTVIEKVEKHLIEYALIHSNNKQTTASEFLGLHRNTLRTKIKELKI
ncbi:MAG: sigma 54-interacting transcriptional regulator [Spirochaetes bacterium]|nr:sigma 54-interacting transcriptional regulator [Spirochaetota bacterium]